jgi:hypothetical protein
MSTQSELSGVGGTSDQGRKRGESLEEMLLRLGIKEHAADDLVFEEEEYALKEGIKWMALARVHTDNFFSPQTFKQHMRYAWSPAKEVLFHALEENLFTIQCSCLGDWMKVKKKGHGCFDNMR